MSRTKLRPREILCEQLKRVRGVLQAKKLPEPFSIGLKRKRKSSFLHEEEEKWRAKKRRKKYSDKEFSKRVLNINKSVEEPDPQLTADDVEQVKLLPGMSLE